MKKGKSNLLRVLISFILILLVFYLSASVVSAAECLEENTGEYIVHYWGLEVDIYIFFSLI